MTYTIYNGSSVLIRIGDVVSVSSAYLICPDQKLVITAQDQDLLYFQTSGITFGLSPIAITGIN